MRPNGGSESSEGHSGSGHGPLVRRVAIATRLAALAGALSFAALIAPTGASAALIGEVSEFTTGIAPSSQPIGIAAGPDGNVWFTERSGLENIGRITPTGEVEQFPIRPNSVPQGIAVGPDGNLWFTEIHCATTGIEGCKSYVGRINPNNPKGDVNDFAMGTGETPSSEPWYIAAGPNKEDALWFTEFSEEAKHTTNQIGRITPAGVVSQFEIPGAGHKEPDGIAAGPDGNVWFTELAANQIGRINPTTHEIKEFPIPTVNSEPVAITAGPDGNLWFTEQDGLKIGRITPAGAITEFPIPADNGEPRPITVGADGNLWFGQDNGQIGRITPAGAIILCQTGIRGPIEGITAGPDESVWFTEFDETRIGRMAVTGSALASNCTSPTPTPTPAPTPTPTPTATPPAPNSAFSSDSATVNAKTGAITFTETVTQPGTFSWLLTFQNGKFGVFAAKSTKCKKGFIKLNGKCRPSKITFGKGRDTVAVAGRATFTVKPSASASKALKEALKHKKGLPVAVTITFQSARGGAAVTHAQSLTVKLKRK
jgi:streptogramin lyase